jgi:hypothetical protein
VTLALTLLLGLLLAPAAAAQTARADFDADGHADLAVGAPGDSVQGQQSAGAVNVIYGSRRGLTERGDEQFTAASANIGSVPASGSRFGAALAAGDLDGDGFDDLAIGSPGSDPGGLAPAPNAGMVIVLYGSRGGLNARAGHTTWSQNTIGIADDAEGGDLFGAALAIADCDGDGEHDLAIGVPGEGVDGQRNAGAVHVLYGRGDGLRAGGDQFFTQNTRGVKGIAGLNHGFGAALAAGDLSRNGRAELAIGVPGGMISGLPEAGVVIVIYGRQQGLSAVDDLWSQNARGIKGFASANDRFGGALAIGDFDGDGAGDLAVGAPIDSVGNALGAGAVNIIYGSNRGLRERGDQLFTQDTAGVKSRASVGETFGSALVAADFSRNGVDDLAIGVPGEQVAGQTLAGGVTVLYGGSSGLDDRASQLWTQDSPGVEGQAERDDRFGTALGAGDFDGDGALDLAIGAPFDSVDGFPDAGAVNVLYGSGSGLRASRGQLWTQGASSVNGAVGNDRFGSSLTAP